MNLYATRTAGLMRSFNMSHPDNMSNSGHTPTSPSARETGAEPNIDRMIVERFKSMKPRQYVGMLGAVLFGVGAVSYGYQAAEYGSDVVQLPPWLMWIGAQLYALFLTLSWVKHKHARWLAAISLECVLVLAWPFHLNMELSQGSHYTVYSRAPQYIDYEPLTSWPQRPYSTDKWETHAGNAFMGEQVIFYTYGGVRCTIYRYRWIGPFVLRYDNDAYMFLGSSDQEKTKECVTLSSDTPNVDTP